MGKVILTTTLIATGIRMAKRPPHDGAKTRPRCRPADADLFFAEAPSDVEAAKAICQPCVLRTQCRAGALERREPWGVWGGELFVNGVIVPQKRPRGRPRKHRVAA